MLNKTTLQTAVIMPRAKGSLGSKRTRPSRTALLDALNDSLYRALNSHFDVTF